MSLPPSDVETPLLGFISADLLPDDEGLDAQTPLLALGIIDSLSMVSILAFIKKTFDVDIAPTDITVDNFDTVTSLARLVRKSMEQGVGRSR